MDTRVYWMDDTDQLAVKAKLESGRKKYTDFDWIRFREDAYDSQDEAFKALLSMLSSATMFSPGIIIYTFGVPFKKNSGDYHPRLVKELERLAPTVCFIVIARPDRGSTLYKAAKALGKAEEAFDLTKANAVDWITAQGQILGLKVDKPACMMLADMTDFNPGLIQNELQKLGNLTEDGHISLRVVEMGSFGSGTTDVKELAQFILKNEGERAHEYLQRLLDRGEPAIKICGYFEDWITRLAIAQAGNCNFEAIKNKVAELKKWESSDKKDKHGNALYEVVDDDRWGRYSRRDGETVAMYSNPKSLWYSCQELREAGRGPNWAYDALYKMGQLQEALRSEDKDEWRLMHRFISSLMRSKE